MKKRLRFTTNGRKINLPTFLFYSAQLILYKQLIFNYLSCFYHIDLLY